MLGEIDVPTRYQKQGRIDFTTRCLAFLFGESGACSSFAFGQHSLRMTGARRMFVELDGGQAATLKGLV
jgi:hypothetical protein